MKFLETQDIAQVAVQVLRSELERLACLESNLKAQLCNTQKTCLADNGPSITQVDCFEDQARAMGAEAEERSRQCQDLKAQVETLHKVARQQEFEQDSKESAMAAEVDGLLAQKSKYLTKTIKYRHRFGQLQQKAVTRNTRVVLSGRYRATSSHKQALRSYPYVIRPGIRDLQPIGEIGARIENILHSNGFTRRFLSSSRHFPYSVGWHGPHAVLFTPSYFLSDGNSWQPFLLPDTEDGRAYHLFLDHGPYIFYRGMYRFHRIQDCVFSGIGRENRDQRLHQILEIAMPRSTPTDVYHTFQDLVVDDVIPIQCMTLQCIGFDQRLYEVLAQRFRKNRKILDL